MIEKIVAMTMAPRRGRDLDAEHGAERAGAVDLGGLVQVGGDDPQGGVEDEHVVAHELPGDDVADGCEDPAGSEGREMGSEQAVDAGGEPELVAVDESPDEGGDDRRDRIRQEDRDAEEGGAVEPGAVEGEGCCQRQHQHDRHLDDEEERHPAERLPEFRIGEHPEIIVEADEVVAADELLAKETEVEGVDHRRDDHRDEDDHERSDERPATPVASLAPKPAGRARRSE